MGAKNAAKMGAPVDLGQVGEDVRGGGQATAKTNQRGRWVTRFGDIGTSGDFASLENAIGPAKKIAPRRSDIRGGFAFVCPYDDSD